MNAVSASPSEAEVHNTSMLLWQPTASHVIPKEMEKQLWPKETAEVNPCKDEIQQSAIALYIFEDEGKTPTLCDCS